MICENCTKVVEPGILHGKGLCLPWPPPTFDPAKIVIECTYCGKALTAADVHGVGLCCPPLADLLRDAEQKGRQAAERDAEQAFRDACTASVAGGYAAKHGTPSRAPESQHFVVMEIERLVDTLIARRGKLLRRKGGQS